MAGGGWGTPEEEAELGPDGQVTAQLLRKETRLSKPPGDPGTWGECQALSVHLAEEVSPKGQMLIAVSVPPGFRVSFTRAGVWSLDLHGHPLCGGSTDRPLWLRWTLGGSGRNGVGGARFSSRL